MKRQRTSSRLRATAFTPLRIGALVLTGAVLLAACGGGGATPAAGNGMPVMATEVQPGGDGANASTPIVTVQIDNFAFSPATVTVKPGSTVAWSNDDSVGHDVTIGTGRIASGTLNQHDTFSQVFPTTGTYQYLCSIHPFMHGTVIVTS
jgi:plastocyanin